MKKHRSIVLLNKKEGETPLEALELFRRKNKEYKDMPMTYAGRLDPMASGVLILLAGEETKNKEKYLKLDKEYEFSILFGFSTDTFDILGKVLKKEANLVDADFEAVLAWSLTKEEQNSRNLGAVRWDGENKQATRFASFNKKYLENSIKTNLNFFTGKFIQKYPMYSSKTVAGKPLFVYARNGEDVDVPDREVNVKSLKFLRLRVMGAKRLLENIEKRIKKVKGDFRQKDILKTWQKSLRDNEQKFYIADFKIKCSSGTYVRSIANGLGEKIGLPALAFKIKRTRIYI